VERDAHSVDAETRERRDALFERAGSSDQPRVVLKAVLDTARGCALARAGGRADRREHERECEEAAWSHCSSHSPGRARRNR
jgi:hypothetical protein